VGGAIGEQAKIVGLRVDELWVGDEALLVKACHFLPLAQIVELTMFGAPRDAVKD
jgi:hypothetical protein